MQEPGPGSGVGAGVSPVPTQQTQGRAAAQEPDRPLGAGQGTVPVMGSAHTKALQSSGSAPRAPRDILQPGRDSGAGTASTREAKPFCSGVTQPGAALVGWGEAAQPPCASTDTQTQPCTWLSPWEGPRNVTVMLTANPQCPAWNRNIPGELLIDRPLSQPTLSVPGSPGLSAAGLGLSLLNSPGDEHCPSGCQLSVILFSSSCCTRDVLGVKAAPEEHEQEPLGRQLGQAGCSASCGSSPHPRAGLSLDGNQSPQSASSTAPGGRGPCCHFPPAPIG